MGDQSYKDVSSSSPTFPSPMSKISRHYFGKDSSEVSHDFFIDIIENIREEYGMFVWPCSIILAEYIYQQRTRFSTATTVVELGAGTSLPGLVAAKLGVDNVILTDDSSRTDVLENIEKICSLNELDCRVLGLTWGEWDASMFDLQPQIVLGADVFYNASHFEQLFATVAFFLQNSPGSVFITAYHNRSGHHLIEFMMVKWRLKCTKLLDGFSFMPPIKASSLQGNIQIVEIMLDY